MAQGPPGDAPRRYRLCWGRSPSGLHIQPGGQGPGLSSPATWESYANAMVMIPVVVFFAATTRMIITTSFSAMMMIIVAIPTTMTMMMTTAPTLAGPRRRGARPTGQSCRGSLGSATRGGPCGYRGPWPTLCARLLPGLHGGSCARGVGRGHTAPRGRHGVPCHWDQGAALALASLQRWGQGRRSCSRRPSPRFSSAGILNSCELSAGTCATSG